MQKQGLVRFVFIQGTFLSALILISNGCLAKDNPVWYVHLAIIFSIGCLEKFCEWHISMRFYQRLRDRLKESTN